MRPNFLARPASDTSKFLSAFRTVRLRLRCRPPRLAPRWCISAPPVEGVLRLVRQTRKQKIQKTSDFLEPIPKMLKLRENRMVKEITIRFHGARIG